MSKQNNLTDFLTDVANAIRAKKGSTDLINPQNFSAEIASLSGGLEVIDMTETTATIEPNKVYVWGMVASLDITLGGSTDESDFFAFRFRCSKPNMTSVTVNGATWAEDTELDETGKPVLDLGSWYQCEIKGGTSALYARLAHYIPFADSNVEAVLLANGVGDGLGVTYNDAAKVTSISTWFKDNADIIAFAEFVNFSGIRDVVKTAFNGCSSLTEIALPASLTSIEENAFNGCTSLVEITLPASLTSIGNYAFQNCAALTKVNGLGSTQVTALTGAFNDCTSLVEITLPASLTSIGNYAFQNCAALTKVNGLGSTQVTALTGAFNGCTSLVEITLPASLTSIGNYAFQNCAALTKVNGLGSTQVTSVGNYVFQDCAALIEITLPATLTSIGNYVFRGCKSLKYFRVNANIPPTLSWSPAFPSTIVAIYVPDESVEAYKTATGWTSYASKIMGISEMPAE